MGTTPVSGSSNFASWATNSLSSGESVASGPAVASRAAREATAGPLATDSPELSEFVAQLAKLLEPDTGVVPIESLFFADQGPHVVDRGTAPASAPGAHAPVAAVPR